MKKLIVVITLSLLTLTGFSQSKTRVKSYTKKNGHRVEAHDRTRKDRTKRNNWSTKGNRNPETGKKGYKKAKK